MGLILLLLIGAFVGWVASIITKRDAEQGWIANIVVGVVGALIGTGISRLLTGGDHAGLVLGIGPILWSIAGAVVLCLILNWIQGRSNSRRVL
jgi:uncharacterized membrane protein YeaQ/YmgE (transglycosylase-associated protein family)